MSELQELLLQYGMIKELPMETSTGCTVTLKRNGVTMTLFSEPVYIEGIVAYGTLEAFWKGKHVSAYIDRDHANVLYENLKNGINKAKNSNN